MKKLTLTFAMVLLSTVAYAKDPLPADMKHYSLQDLYAQCGVYFYQAGNTYKFKKLMRKGKSKFGANFENHWRATTYEVIDKNLSNYQFKQLMDMKYYAWSCYYADMS